MADITMPQLGETVTEGTITKWFKAVGDSIAEDETLFEVSTDKVDSEVPSPSTGFVAEILVQEGETVDVGATLARISDAPPNGATAPTAEAPAAAPPSTAPPATESAPSPAAPEVTEPEVTEPEVTEAPAAAADPLSATETADGQKTAAPADYNAASAPADRQASAPSSDGSSRLLSPVVRRLISEHGLDPSAIPGTGAGGRITRSDVLALVEGGAGEQGTGADTAAIASQATKELARGDAPAAKGQPLQPDADATARERDEAATRGKAPAPAPLPATRETPAGGRDEVIPFSNIRRRTAEHMVRSKATSAHTLMVSEVDYDNVERVRQPARAGFKADEGVSLTYLPFISRAVVDAIRKFPHVNSSVGDDELVVHHDIHLGIAVDLDFQGLMAPVVHGADGKRLRALGREIADLASRARSRKLGPDQIAGGTFTITNAGPFGTLITGAIINQPQVAILSTDGVKKRPVAIELPSGDDAIVVHPVGNLALTWDHRAFDGAYAAAFLAKVKEILETRDWLAEIS